MEQAVLIPFHGAFLKLPPAMIEIILYLLLCSYLESVFANLKIEVNIFDLDKDIYNQTITVNFLKRIRDEKKFDNLDSLIKQLGIDKEGCLNFLASTL